MAGDDLFATKLLRLVSECLVIAIYLEALGHSDSWGELARARWPYWRSRLSGAGAGLRMAADGLLGRGTGTIAVAEQLARLPRPGKDA